MNKNFVMVGIVALLVIAGTVFMLTGKKDTPTQSSADSTQSSEQATSYTSNQVAQHNSQSDCWTIVSGSVYNITAYVPQHPGGISEITKICGRDGTSLFEGTREHDATADTQLARLKIGTLAK